MKPGGLPFGQTKEETIPALGLEIVPTSLHCLMAQGMGGVAGLYSSQILGEEILGEHKARMEHRYTGVFKSSEGEAGSFSDTPSEAHVCVDSVL